MRLPRVWPLTVIPRAPEGMSLEDARLAGLVPPAGYRRPPRPRPADVARTAAAFASIVTGLTRALVSGSELPPSVTEDGRSAIAAACLTVLARLGVTLEVRGAAEVPRDGGLVFMWNQGSHLDHLVLPPAIPRPFHTLYNNEIRATPVYGRYLERTGHFWIDRTNETQWRTALAAIAARIQEGACVVLSPEGTRSWDGTLLPMKRGAFILARQAERPIVCVTLLGAPERLPRACLAVRPGKVRVVLSAPIPVRADDPALEDKVRRTFQAELDAAG